MEPVRPDTLAFFAPGLLHQLGNVLFTIQGNAQVARPDGAEAGREQRAILGAVERGADALRILRCLLGDAAAPPALAGVLLGQVAELMRVPVREARHSLDLRHSATKIPVLVDPSDFCIAVLEGIRVLVAIVPTGVHGIIVLDLCDLGARHATVRLSFQPPSGALPFPLAVEELLVHLGATRLRLRGQPTLRSHGMGVEMVFAGRGAHQEAEA